jgi:hypothetical protein
MPGTNDLAYFTVGTMIGIITLCKLDHFIAVEKNVYNNSKPVKQEVNGTVILPL